MLYTDESPLQILICEDHPFCRLGIETSLTDILEMPWNLRSSSTVKHALALAHEIRPHLVLVDLQLPDASGLDLIRELKLLYPSIKILVITSSENPVILRQAVQMNIAGMMQKISSTEHLTEILDQILYSEMGEPVLDSRMKAILSSEEEVDLTPREYEVLEKIVQGYSNREIAESLRCAVTTIRFHRSNIMEKTNIRNAAEMTAWYLQGQRKGD